MQPWKALPPIVVKELGKAIETRPEQLENANCSIDVRVSGRVIEVMPVQPLNALFPIDIKEFGRVMEVRPEHHLNAASPIAVTEYCIPLYDTEEGTSMSPVYDGVGW